MPRDQSLYVLMGNSKDRRPLLPNACCHVMHLGPGHVQAALVVDLGQA